MASDRSITFGTDEYSYYSVTIDSVREALEARGLHIVTAAEKRVLDAMAEVHEAALKQRVERGKGLGLGDSCEAELARRESAKDGK